VAEYIVAGGGKRLRPALLLLAAGAVGFRGAARLELATVVAHGRGDKVRIFKLRRRKHYQKSQGHRQNYTEVRIDDIVAGA